MLLVGTVDGVVVAQRTFSGWAIVGRKLPGCHISSLLSDPTNHLVLAGSHTGGLFVSRDEGETWDECPAFTGTNVYTVALKQGTVGARLYVGTQPAGLFQSDDGARTWIELPNIRSVPNADKWTFPAPPHLGHVKNVAFHPVNDDVMFVCIEQGGLFRSHDGGATWIELENISHPTDAAYKDVHRLAIQRSRPQTMYFSGGDGVSVSRDEGETWAKLVTRASRIGYPDALFISPLDPAVMFMAGARRDPSTWHHSHFADATVLRSEDAGASWSPIENGLPTPLHGNIEAMSMFCSDSNVGLIFATTDGDVFESVDAGDSWNRVLAGIPSVSKVGHHLLLQHA